ncbi:hypothetical protein G6O67_006737 [Ophiocordyceps sinensis]|nr:hypothetical protein G6O67_006737 [Ophiocordyceps sinensis]
MLVQGLVQAVASLAQHGESHVAANGAAGSASEAELAELVDFIGPMVGQRIASSTNNRGLVRTILDARLLE